MNRSNRFGKLMQSMGMEKSPEQPRRKMSGPAAPTMDPSKIEALTGMEHPASEEQKRMAALLDSKIAQLEQEGDLESLEFWKQKRAELLGQLTSN